MKGFEVFLKDLSKVSDGSTFTMRVVVLTVEINVDFLVLFCKNSYSICTLTPPAAF